MTTLNSLQQQSYNSAQQLASFLRQNKRICRQVIPFRNEVETFLRHFDSISALASAKATKGIAITSQKKELKKELAREAAEICTLATAYALETNNITLLKWVNNSYTAIVTTKDILLRPLILCITQAITPCFENEDFLGYGITPGALASITEKAEQFVQSIGHGKMVNFHSNNASNNITTTLRKIKASIKQLNRLLILFKNTQPGFIQDFHQALIITQTAKPGNILEGTITATDTAQPLCGITITAEGKNKTAITGATGFFHLPRLKAGAHNLLITAEGYAPQTIQVKIVRGKTVTLSIALEALPVHMPKAGVA